MYQRNVLILTDPHSNTFHVGDTIDLPDGGTGILLSWTRLYARYKVGRHIFSDTLTTLNLAAIDAVVLFHDEQEDEYL